MPWYSWITFEWLPKNVGEHICVSLLLEARLRSIFCPSINLGTKVTWFRSITALWVPDPSLLKLFPLSCVLCISIWGSHFVSFSTACSSMELAHKCGENSTFTMASPKCVATLSPFTGLFLDSALYWTSGLFQRSKSWISNNESQIIYLIYLQAQSFQ